MARKRRLAAYLALVESYEKAQWTFVNKLAKVLSIDENKLPGLYLRAWANTFLEAGRSD